MYRIVVSCRGIAEREGAQGAIDVAEEFLHRPWHHAVDCRWDSGVLRLQAENDFDADGQALLDEFTDAVFACLPLEGGAIVFTVESARENPEEHG